MTNSHVSRRAAAARLLALRRARTHMLDFMRHVWWMPQPLLEGLHTRAICGRLTRAVDDFKRGRSTFLVVQVPFRHGKSDMVSRALPAYFLGRCRAMEPDVIMTGYGSSLVESFSRRVKAIIGGRAYPQLFPGVELSKTKNAAGKWAVEGSAGEVTVAGLGGPITGSGGHLIVVDDYCKRREEAESPAYREKTWEAFSDDVMTRRAPACIVVVCATPWHADDITGRIRREMENNAYFPKFEFLTFPAESEQYPSGYLFPERFSPEWYASQRATLGAYSAAGLLDCAPTVRGGNLFNLGRLRFHDRPAEFPDCRYVRFWDLASTAKEVAKDDPDYTAGALVGVTHGGLLPELWVKDLVAGQWEAPARNARILATAERDGPAVAIGVEAVAGYKDAYTTLRDALHGRRRVVKVPVSSDKVVRAAPLEAVFEAGNVHLARGPWNGLFLRHFSEFPVGSHDDVADAVAGGWHMLAKHGAGAPFERAQWGL